jgi:hypothetical protein
MEEKKTLNEVEPASVGSTIKWPPPSAERYWFRAPFKYGSDPLDAVSGMQ